MRKTKAEKAIDARITRLYGQVASGVQIPLLDVPKVWRAARGAVDAGKDDTEVASAIRTAVDAIRVNDPAHLYRGWKLDRY